MTTSSRNKKLALGDSVRFFGNLLAGPAELRQWAPVRVKSGDHPVVIFRAPELPIEEQNSYALLTLIDQIKPIPRKRCTLARSQRTGFARKLQNFLPRADPIFTPGCAGRRPPDEAIDSSWRAPASALISARYAHVSPLLRLKRAAIPLKPAHYWSA